MNAFFEVLSGVFWNVFMLFIAPILMAKAWDALKGWLR